MRFSVGILLSEEIKESVLAAQSALKTEFSKLVWLEREQLFLALKFLGNPHLSRMGQIKRALKNISSGIAPFSFSLTNLGCFPETGIERTVWCGVKDPSRMLSRLVSDCEKEFSKLNIAPNEKEFVAHIPIGRAPKNDTQGKVRKRASQIKLTASAQDVSEIFLVCAKLKKGAPTYEVFSKYPLSASIL